MAKRKDGYADYLRSDHWLAKREEAFAHYGRKCARCPATRRLQIHHKTYKRIFDEPMVDLEVLCASCHRKQHGIEVSTEARNGREFKVTVLPPGRRPPTKRRRKYGNKARKIRPPRSSAPSKVKTKLIAQNDALREIQRRNKEKRERAA